MMPMETLKEHKNDRSNTILGMPQKHLLENGDIVLKEFKIKHFSKRRKIKENDRKGILCCWRNIGKWEHTTTKLEQE